MSEGAHILTGRFLPKTLPISSAQYDWVRDAFNAAAPADFRCDEEDQFIEVTSDSSLRLKLVTQTLSEFWIGVEREHPLIAQRAVRTLLHFATLPFSAVASLKTKTNLS